MHCVMIMENGREQNFWPGFVDALSNLVLTLVFVMVIFERLARHIGGERVMGIG